MKERVGDGKLIIISITVSGMFYYIRGLILKMCCLSFPQFPM